MHYREPLIGVVSLTLLANYVPAEDWPQYLGPNRNSISPLKGILRTWPEKGPEVLWTTAVGKGWWACGQRRHGLLARPGG